MEEKIAFETIGKKIEELESRISKLEILIAAQPPKLTQKKLSLREFVLSKKPNTEAQVGLLIGYYLEHFEGKTSFTAKDISDGFRLAKEPVPANVSDIIFKNAKKAFIDETKEKTGGIKSWTLTNSGIQEIEGGGNPSKPK